MSRLYYEYEHIKCKEHGCTGNAKFDNSSGYICDKCGKPVPYHYVESQRDLLAFNEMTGWVYPMKRRD